MPDKPIESGLAKVENQSLTYSEYLGLDAILSAQHPLADPPHHDEMLFIVQHQIAELWFKLSLHELRAAIDMIRNDHLEPCTKIIARIKIVQQQLFSQWAVLETLTPIEYVQMRDVLGTASGFQSLQYRQFEFALGNKNRAMLDIHGVGTPAGEILNEWLNRPSIYDEFLRHLHRKGHNVPAERVNRDWGEPYVSHPGVVEVFKRIYENPQRYWDAYDVSEKLVDLEENFQLWRFRHMKTVERIIGYKKGTGGSSGVPFLRRALEMRFFPELLEVRTEIEA
ncbi:MAG: tryptophan 2,3-dioxygenase [Gammaproteobacteria bacterium]|nr:tryptophan 2,3-dioxygenase [Gammaproteobacteria bacterium]NNF61603.1 tryptophan 2,3-dioxygenase [Gammaproteobacteria bacterium]